MNRRGFFKAIGAAVVAVIALPKAIALLWRPKPSGPVYVSAVQGDDDTADGMADRPYRTLQAGMNAMSRERPTMYLLPGTYTAPAEGISDPPWSSPEHKALIQGILWPTISVSEGESDED